METIIYTVEVTLAGKTKEVEFRYVPGLNNAAHSGYRIFCAQTLAGTKMHAASMIMWTYDTKEEARGKSNYSEVIELHDGRFGFLSSSVMVRNREARILGWAEDFIGTDLETKQNYYGALKEAK